MTQIIKLTSKKRFTLDPDSSPDVPVNENVEIPPNHYGEFYIRKKFGRKGITVPSSPFPANWSGIPNITLVHGGANEEEFLAGDEIGELHIRYDSPSPFAGGSMELSSAFVLVNVGDHLHVYTEDGKVYKCSSVHQPGRDVDVTDNFTTEHDCVSIGTGPFSPSFIMTDYEFVRYLTKEESTLHSFKLTEQRLQAMSSTFGDDGNITKMINDAVTQFRDQTNIPESQPYRLKVQHTHHGYPINNDTTKVD